MTTLFDATRELAAFLTNLWESEATDGTDASLTDSLAAFGNEAVNGTLWMLDGGLEGMTLRVTAAASATVLEFPTQAALVSAGDGYVLANSDFPLALLKRSINRALREYADRRTEDETLETISTQERYTLPEGVKDVREVWQAGSVDEPYRWFELHHWDEVGTELVFATGFAPQYDGYRLKIVYRGAHEDLTDDADELPSVDERLIHWQAAVHAVGDGMARFHEDPLRGLVNKMNEAQAKLSEARRNWRPWVRSARVADY